MKNIENNLYGFSTADSISTGNIPVVLYNYELAKQDLINSIYTRRGERLMRPTFGSIIWQYIMEPLIDSNRDIIINDLQNIVNSDPRFNPIDIAVTEYEYGLSVQITLLYVPVGSVDTFQLDFDNRQLNN